MRRNCLMHGRFAEVVFPHMQYHSGPNVCYGKNTQLTALAEPSPPILSCSHALKRHTMNKASTQLALFMVYG
jgi:hypothetical protein